MSVQEASVRAIVANIETGALLSSRIEIKGVR